MEENHSVPQRGRSIDSHPPCTGTRDKRHGTLRGWCCGATALMAAIAAVVMTACSHGSSSTAAPGVASECTGGVTHPGPTIALVVDGRSPAIDNLVQTIENSRNDPSVAWKVLNGEDGDTKAGGKSGPGVVLVAVPDAAGNVDYPVMIDLRGDGPNETIARANARAQTRCLATRLAAMPASTTPASVSSSSDAPAPKSQPDAVEPIESQPGPALVSALPKIAATARRQAGEHSATLAVYGLGRSSIVGRPWVSIGLKDDQRPQVFEQLAKAGLVLPDLADMNVNLRWIDPGDGAPDEIIASGLTSLAADLCNEMNVKSCEVTQ